MKEQNNHAKILLNCMPPAQILMPSITLNILKSVLRQNGGKAEIIYWNLKLETFFKDWAKNFGEDNFEFARLLPFVYFKAKQYYDLSAMERIRNILLTQAELSAKKNKRKISPTFISSLPDKTIVRIEAFIKDELAGYDFTNVILSGFTAKFYQWLPALLIAGETKKKHPHIKTIIGGFDTRHSAAEMLRNFDCFDLAIWGEGEYPLLQITDVINNGGSDFSEIPGLVYREKNEIIVSKKRDRQYLDLDHYPDSDYDDFYSVAKEDRKKGRLFGYPVESIRGCLWNKCKFCVLNKGYKYRERDADSVIKEIEQAIKKYQVGYFQFMDNSLIGVDSDRLDSMLKEMTALSLACPDDFSLAAEIIPYGLDASFYKKLALAGFRMMQIGGESFADSLIKKMNKMNSFSDNLLAYKCCLKYGITPIGANIITGIPGETSKDIQTCIDNIPFLRYFVGDRLINFAESKFALDKQSKFYKELDEKEIEKYNDHFFYNYLPQTMTGGMNRFELFSFCKNKTSIQKKLWEKFFKTLNSYHKAQLTYKIYGHGNVVQFEEYCNNVKTDSLLFDQPEQWQILVHANTRLCTFEEMLHELKNKYQNVTISGLKTMMNELKSKHLLYFDENYNKIVSVIDTDCLL
ncbi:MAG TPA: radical SAM protein [Bacteroidales bacterium]|nr:radical SAM protein [Bacteroidales bacterium]